jgi:hypothetical protein
MNICEYEYDQYSYSFRSPSSNSTSPQIDLQLAQMCDSTLILFSFALL